MMPTLALMLMFCASVLSLNDKHANRTKTDRTHLGMSLDDPRIINRGAACPPDCPSDCRDAYDQGGITDGPYIIYISTDAMRPLVVQCDMESNGGGWTFFQRRINGVENFHRDWVDYVDGFGQLNSEHWLGLHDLHLLLAQKRYRLRVDLVDFNGSTPYAEYAYFTVGSPFSEYALGINRFMGGTAGDSLKYPGGPTLYDQTNMMFSTRDHDNDINPGNCAASWVGAWWHNSCTTATLNGNYTTNSTAIGVTYITWYTWRGNWNALKSTAMKFYPM